MEYINLLSLLGWIRGSTKAFINSKELSYSDHTHSLDNLSGVLPITKGGTGVESLDKLKNLLGISNITNIEFDCGYGNVSVGYVNFNRVFTNTPYVTATYNTDQYPSADPLVLCITNINSSGFNVFGEYTRFSWIAILIN